MSGVSTWPTSHQTPLETRFQKDGTAIRRGYTNYIWHRWIRGTLPHGLGEHAVRVRAGTAGAVIECLVRAYVGTASGKSTIILLKEASSGQLHRARIDTTFQLPASLSLRAFQTEKELAELLSSDTVPVVVHRVRVPASL